MELKEDLVYFVFVSITETIWLVLVFFLVAVETLVRAVLLSVVAMGALMTDGTPAPAGGATAPVGGPSDAPELKSSSSLLPKRSSASAGVLPTLRSMATLISLASKVAGDMLGLPVEGFLLASLRYLVLRDLPSRWHWV